MNSLASALRAGLYGLPEEAGRQAAGAIEAEILRENREFAGEETTEATQGRLRFLLQPRPLILTGLPYKRDDALRSVTRVARVGVGSRLTVTYLATDPAVPLPFGADRGLLAWMMTRAFADGIAHLGAIREYFVAFGLSEGGQGYRIFRERYQRITNLALRIEETSPEARTIRRLFVTPAAREPLALEPGAEGALRSRDHSPYGFSLDEGFWRYLRDTRIPTPLDLLRAFHDAPQAWDFCQLALFRCYSARTASVIPWAELLNQLGTTTTHPRRLKSHLAGVLHTVRGFYPDFPARFLAGLTGLEVRPWRMPMSE